MRKIYIGYVGNDGYVGYVGYDGTLAPTEYKDLESDLLLSENRTSCMAAKKKLNVRLLRLRELVRQNLEDAEQKGWRIILILLTQGREGQRDEP